MRKRPPSRLQYPLTVFYDASCPLCATEMHALKARDRDGLLELVDCSGASFDAADLGLPVTRAALMERIHARDGDGRWLTGVDVFEAAYGAAGLKKVARFWSSAKLRPVLVFIYPWIARNRQRLSRIGLARLLALALPIVRPNPAKDAEAAVALGPHDRDLALCKVGRAGDGMERIAVAHDHGVHAG